MVERYLTNNPEPIKPMYENEFPLEHEIIYLNHAAVAPWPTRTAKAVSDFALENSLTGASNYLKWLKVEDQLRHRLASLINTPSADDIALQKNTSEALSVIAMGLDWREGENVVSYRDEFPSNRIVWQSLDRFGVESRLVDFEDADSPEQALFDACNSSTRLISVSSVQYHTGLRMDLDKIARFCRDNNILLCVDAIQSLGALPFDVQALEPDFVVADGHKWMLGPEGLALLYVKPELRDRLNLNEFGWHMLEKAHDFSSFDLTPAPNAKRFECGSPNLLGCHALNASLGLLLEIGLESVSDTLLEKSALMIETIEASDRLQLLTDPTPSRRSGIVTFSVQDHDSELIYKALMRQGVICAPRGGGIRFSPHFYTPNSGIEEAFDRALSI